MTTAEQAALAGLEKEALTIAQGVAHFVVDSTVPSAVNAEISKLPLGVSAIVSEVFNAEYPKFQAALDAAIDAKVASLMPATTPAAS